MDSFDDLWDTFKARVREARTAQQATVAASDGGHNNNK